MLSMYFIRLKRKTTNLGKDILYIGFQKTKIDARKWRETKKKLN